MQANTSVEGKAAEYDKAPEKEVPPVVNAVRLEEGVSSK